MLRTLTFDLIARLTWLWKNLAVLVGIGLGLVERRR